jgi:hypothetical protein
MNDAVFSQSIECLSRHRRPEWGDLCAMDVFNRLVAKSIRPDGWTTNTHLDIKSDQVQSRQEHWTADALKKLTRGHSRTAGKDFDCPIVIAEYDGAQLLIDGTTRINRWIAKGEMPVHKVNVHTIPEVGQFIEIPGHAKGA